MQFGLLITSRCNAACTHCATSCGPQRHGHLPESELLRVMDEAAALHRTEAQGQLVFSISGGEPFLDLVLLTTLVSHGTALGGAVSCQTNGYWASNDIKARQILARLKEAGLVSLGVSASRFHEQFVRRSRVERALAIARQLGIETALKCALTQGDTELEQWARACAVDVREIFPVHPYLREGARLDAGAYRARPGIPQAPCPAAVLTLREDGQAYTCCSPGGFNAFLRLGDIGTDSIEQLRDHFHIGGRQQILRRHGPAHFVGEIERRGLAGRLRPAYADVCDLCCHIGNDPQMAAVASEVSAQFEQDQLRDLFERMAQAAEC